MKTTIKNFVKNTWKHFVAFFITLLLITLFWSNFNEGLQLFGQILVGFVLSFVSNWGFEIYQRNKGGIDTFKQIIEDCFSAGIGGIVGVLIANIFI